MSFARRILKKSMVKWATSTHSNDVAGLPDSDLSDIVARLIGADLANSGKWYIPHVQC